MQGRVQLVHQRCCPHQLGALLFAQLWWHLALVQGRLYQLLHQVLHQVLPAAAAAV
jgi:hypothetical protein